MPPLAQRPRPRRRQRHAPAYGDAGHQQAAAAGVRQTDDLPPSMHVMLAGMRDILIISTPSQGALRFAQLLWFAQKR